MSDEHYHAVRFYEDDGSLCRIVGSFLGDGFSAGQPAVVIATPSHRQGIVRVLESLSFDIEHLIRKGALVVIDAEELLSTFMKEGGPDPAAFDRTVGGLLDGLIATHPGATVRAYGEMVDWLWKNSEAEMAIRLEVLWNELAASRTFSLLCGYSIGNFYKHGAFENICAQHSHVISTNGKATRVGVA
jgi:hypothetical protein